MRYLLGFLFLSISCSSDNEIRLQKRQLQTSQTTYDAGVLSAGDRKTFPITLQSIGPGPVSIYDILSADEDHFFILPSWAHLDTNEDGTNDAMFVGSGTIDYPTEKIVQVNFRPEEERSYKSRVTILSDDSTAQEETEEGYSIFRTSVRGIGSSPCAEVYPSFFDFGKKPAGGTFLADITIYNCGNAPLTISSFDFVGSTSFYPATATPIYILNGESTIVQIAWIPAAAQTPVYREQNEDSVTVSMITNVPGFTETIEIIGNSCNGSVDPDWDGDGDGWSVCGGDCDDNNANIHPGVPEITNNKDDNCNGETDEDELNAAFIDDDGDCYCDAPAIVGCDESTNPSCTTLGFDDCDDNDSSISPDAVETTNMIDDDCNGLIDDQTQSYDDDGDGYSERQGDCNDQDANIAPLMPELENGLDDNCNGNVDEGYQSFDDDGDGYSEDDGDCDDQSLWVYPQATEDCDKLDNDCDGLIDEGPEDQEDGACTYTIVINESDERTVQTSNGCVSTQSNVLWTWCFGLLIFMRRKFASSHRLG